MSKGTSKPKPASSLTDAVVAALGKIGEGEDKTVESDAMPSPGTAEAGCAATRQSAPGEPAPASGANGFRHGPGSFFDLQRRWSGEPPLGSADAGGDDADPQPASVESEPPLVESEEPKPEPAAVEPAAVEAAATKPIGEPAEADADRSAADEVESPPAEEADASPGDIELTYFGRTDVGLVRDHNEDNFLVAEIDSTESNPESPKTGPLEGRGFAFAVCDGMGGAAAGEVASQMAVDTILEVMRSEPVPGDRDEFARRVVTAVEEAGHRIFSAAKMDRSRRGMGTTATLAGLIDDVVFVGQVGDSRAYVLRGDELGLITKDQSLVNQLIEAGQLTEEEAEAFEHSNIILQALGTTEEVTVDLTFLELRRGDRMMMCSDGLSGLVHAEMIKEVLQTEKDPDAAATKLIQMANAGGGHDNITVIIVDFDGEGLSVAGDAKPCYQQYPLPPGDDTVRGRSLPPRQMAMKAGGTKPGADVKSNDYAAADSEEVTLPGSDSKLGIIAMMIVLLLVGVAGAWFFVGGGQEMLSGDGSDDESQPPIPDDSERPVDDGIVRDPLGDPGALEPLDAVDPDTEDPADPAEQDPGAVEAALGTVEIVTDIERGTLRVGGEPRGAISNGMSLELPAGTYSFEAWRGEVRLAGPESVDVREGQSTRLELNVPVVQMPPVAEPRPPRQVRPPRDTPSGGRSTGGRRRGSETGSGRPATGPIDPNPF